MTARVFGADDTDGERAAVTPGLAAGEQRGPPRPVGRDLRSDSRGYAELTAGPGPFHRIGSYASRRATRNTG